MEASGSIVIADGDGDARGTTAGVLRRAGYEAIEADTGGEVVDVVRGGAVALVLLEVMLPDITGYEVCRQLRADHGDRVAIFFVSGLRTEPLDRVAGLLLGADDYIVKPFDANELVARVQRFVLRNGPTRPAASSPADAPHLTDREQEVLELLVTGWRPKQIAQELTISPKTVATHIQNLLRKFDVHSRSELVARAYTGGVVRVA